MAAIHEKLRSSTKIESSINTWPKLKRLGERIAYLRDKASRKHLGLSESIELTLLTKRFKSAYLRLEQMEVRIDQLDLDFIREKKRATTEADRTHWHVGLVELSRIKKRVREGE
jgi:hypothetical protein